MANRRDHVTLGLAVAAMLSLSAAAIRRYWPVRQVLERRVSQEGLPTRLTRFSVQLWVQKDCVLCEAWAETVRRETRSDPRLLVIRHLPSLDSSRSAFFPPDMEATAHSAVTPAEAIAVADADLLDIGMAPAILVGTRLLLGARDTIAVRKWLAGALSATNP